MLRKEILMDTIKGAIDLEYKSKQSPMQSNMDILKMLYSHP